MKKFARLAAFGALGASAAVTGLYLLIAIGGRHTPGSGIDATNDMLTRISAAVPAAAIVAAHIAYAVRLLRYARENQA